MQKWICLGSPKRTAPFYTGSKSCESLYHIVAKSSTDVISYLSLYPKDQNCDLIISLFIILSPDIFTNRDILWCRHQVSENLCTIHDHSTNSGSNEVQLGPQVGGYWALDLLDRSLGIIFRYIIWNVVWHSVKNGLSQQCYFWHSV